MVIRLKKLVRALEQEFIDYNKAINLLHFQIGSLGADQDCLSTKHNSLLGTCNKFVEKYEK